MRRRFAAWLADIVAGEVARHLENQLLHPPPGAERIERHVFERPRPGEGRTAPVTAAP